MAVDFLPGNEDNYVICTSGTRPMAYEGLMIYETDTKKTFVYNGTLWSPISGGSGDDVMMWMTRV